MRSRNYVVVGHARTKTPADDLVEYLNAQHSRNVLHITHTFEDAPDRTSFYRWYKNGELYREGRGRDYAKLPEPFVYLKELLVTFFWVARLGDGWQRYVGMDGLSSLLGIFLRRIGLISSVDYWAIDFVPKNRFPEKWKNNLYASVNHFAALHANEMWDLSESMAEQKERIAHIRRNACRTHRVVPHGAWTARIPRLRYDDCEQHTLMFMGHLLEKQGVQLVLKAIPAIVERIPDFKFKVIGDGPYAAALGELARALKIDGHVIFTGSIVSHVEMEVEMARCSAAIAPYVKSLDRWTQFGADPGKIKTYLGCGLPILVTDVPSIAKHIETRGCGKLISEDARDIADSVVELLTNAKLNQACRESSAAFVREFDWESIFDGIGL